MSICSFLFSEKATTRIYTYRHTLSLPDGLPICVRLYGEAGADQRDARPRRGLAGDGQPGLRDRQRRAPHVDHAANFEHDDARPLCLDRRLERARTVGRQRRHADDLAARSEEHTSELQSLMRISYAVFCLKKNTKKKINLINQ